MADVGIFYGSTTGNTRDVCSKLQAGFTTVTADLHDVAQTPLRRMAEYRLVIVAGSAWGRGDVQDDWEVALPQLDAIGLAGRFAAALVLGDQKNYPDTFVDCLWDITAKLSERGAQVVGRTSTKGYEFNRSRAAVNGEFLGLVIDEDTQSALTDIRIRDWVQQLLRETRLTAGSGG